MAPSLLITKAFKLNSREMYRKASTHVDSCTTKFLYVRCFVRYCFKCLKAMNQVAMCSGLHYDAARNQAYCFRCLKAMNQVAMCLGLHYDAASNQAYCFRCLKAMNQVAMS